MDDIKVDEWIRTFWCRSGGEDFTGWRIIAAGASPEVIAAAGECLEWNPVLQVHASYGYPATGRNQVGSCCVDSDLKHLIGSVRNVLEWNAAAAAGERDFFGGTIEPRPPVRLFGGLREWKEGFDAGMEGAILTGWEQPMFREGHAQAQAAHAEKGETAAKAGMGRFFLPGAAGKVAKALGKPLKRRPRQPVAADAVAIASGRGIIEASSVVNWDFIIIDDRKYESSDPDSPLYILKRPEDLTLGVGGGWPSKECALAAAGRWLNSSTAWKNCTESRPDFGEVKVDVWEKPGKNGGAVDPEECVLLALKHDRRLCCSMAGRTL